LLIILKKKRGFLQLIAVTVKGTTIRTPEQTAMVITIGQKTIRGKSLVILHHLKIAITQDTKAKIKKAAMAKIIIIKMVECIKAGIIIKKIMVVQDKIIKIKNPIIKTQKR
jgi:hypothetical protein